MPPAYITIPQSEYRTLLQEVRRGAEVCGEVSALRVLLLGLVRRLPDEESALLEYVKTASESCEEVARLRVELSALERRLREFDQELTPIRPPSRTDIQAAFENSVDFASGKRKPPG